MVPPIDPCEIGTPAPCGSNPSLTYPRYPCDFDDPRPAQDSLGLPVIQDLITPVIAEVANRTRESTLAIEFELGIQPSGTFTTVRDRLDNIESILCSLSQGVVGGGGYTPVHEALTVTSIGQTNFTLSDSAWSNLLLLWVGGIKQEIGNYTVSGTSLTWSGLTLIPGDVVEVLYFIDDGGSGGGGGSASVAMAQDVFTAIASQTVFVASGTPVNQQATELFIDGVSMTVGVDYTLSGSTVTYSGAPPLIGGETVVVKYLYNT
jgi:hypothetical protein